MSKGWVDYSRRTDPAHKKGVKILQQKLKKDGYPAVLCFWTKGPDLIYRLYKDIIKDMQAHGTLVLMQTTINGYKKMENISESVTRLDRIIKLLGGPEYIRLRFDPVIVGYTTPNMFLSTRLLACKHGIKHIIVNFLVPHYKGVGKLLKDEGFNIKNPSTKYKADILKWMRNETPEEIDIAVCAESNSLTNMVDGILPPACSDPNWAIQIKPELKGTFNINPSRQGCGCCYDDDWGQYRSRGGYKCPFDCLYCYAK